MQYLEYPFKKFLSHGGFAQVTVGVDIENTSAEGLRDLLSLQAAGNFETYIHHNEADTTFHPKVYLFCNDADARLIVGSNKTCFAVARVASAFSPLAFLRLCNSCSEKT